VEPGNNDPANGGDRLEDMLLITKDATRNQTPAPPQLHDSPRSSTPSATS
jgi:Xaa-Pro aminopeptidase